MKPNNCPLADLKGFLLKSQILDLLPYKEDTCFMHFFQFLFESNQASFLPRKRSEQSFQIFYQ